MKHEVRARTLKLFPKKDGSEFRVTDSEIHESASDRDSLSK